MKQKATMQMLAIMDVSSAILANRPCHMASCRTWPWGTYAVGIMSLHETYYVVETGHMRPAIGT